MGAGAGVGVGARVAAAARARARARARASRMPCRMLGSCDGRCTEKSPGSDFVVLVPDCEEGTVDFFPRTSNDPPYTQTDLTIRDAGKS